MKLPDSLHPYMDGTYGELVAKLVNLLVKLGELKGASKMVPISSAHTSTMIYHSSGDEGLDFLDEIVSSGVRFKVPTSVDPVSIDIERYNKIGIPEDYAHAQMRSIRAFAKLGGIGNYTCIPWDAGNAPRYGEHLAWVDTSSLIYANSVIGARTNRHVDPTALAAAITGYTPECELHLSENRLADVMVKVEARLEKTSDFAALGTYAARAFGPKVYVFTGLEHLTFPNELYNYIGPALSTWGRVALYHIVGHTPEAPTLEDVYGKKKSQYEIVFSQKNLDEIYAEFTPTVTGNKFVLLGCPHCTLNELQEIAQLLEGNRIKPNSCLWVLTNLNTQMLAKRNGLIDIIEKAGGQIVSEMCWCLSIKTKDIVSSYDSFVTNSTKALYFSRSLGMPTYLKTREDCIKSILE